MTPPPLWPKLMFEWWQLTPADADRFWRALEASHYSRPTTLRHQFALPGSMAVDVHHFVTQVLTPALAIGIVEDLVHEKRLSRSTANRIQVAMLEQINAHGVWK